MKPYLFAYLCLLVLSSCTPSPEQLIIGNWTLDSIAGPGNKVFKADQTIDMSLNRDGTFRYMWFDYDVGNTLTGKFQTNADDPKTVLTLILEPSDSSNDNLQFGLIWIQSSRLIATRNVGQTLNDSTFRFNERYIFKKK